jgi:DNA-binding CsgD family transcriptional regulator
MWGRRGGERRSVVWASVEATPLRLVRPGRTSSIVVGRDRELRRLRKAAALAEAGGNAAFILGEPGIGKSRLLTELGAMAGFAPDRFLVGGCPPVVALATPYAPFTAAFRPLLRQRGKAWLQRLVGPQARHLAPIIPVLSDAVPSGPTEESRTQLFEAVHALLAAVAGGTLLLLAIEDLHWATESSLALLASLLADPPEGVLIVGTAREEALLGTTAALIGEASRTAGREVIRLEPLGPEEVAAQIAHIAGQPAPAELVRTIHRRTGGNPLLVEEVLAGGDGEADFAANLALRLADLGDEARVVGWLVALDGEPLATNVLADAAGLDEPRLRSAIAACRAAGLLVADGRTASYRYRHALLRDAMLEAIPPLEQPRLHAALAAAIQRADRGSAGAAGRAARHSLAAGRPLDALPLLLQAAREASRGAAFSEAITAQESALHAWRSIPEPASAPVSEARIIGELATLIALSGDVDAANARYLEAVGRSADEEERLLLSAERAQWLWSWGLEVEARPIRRELAEIGAKRGRRVRSLDLLAAMVRAMVGESRFAEAEPLARHAIMRAAREGRADVGSIGHAALGLALGLSDRPMEGARELRLGAEMAAAAGQHLQLVHAAGNHVALLAEHERNDDALEAIERWRSLGKSRGIRLLVEVMDAALLGQLVSRGRWVEAERKASDLDAEATSGVARLTVLIARAALAILRGRLDAANATLALAAVAVEDAQQPHFVGELAYWRVRRAVVAGELDDASALASEQLEAMLHNIEAGVWYELAALAMRVERLRDEAGSRDARRRAAWLLRMERRRRAWRPPILNAGVVRACRLDIRAELHELQDRPSADLRVASAEVRDRLVDPAAKSGAWLRAAQALMAEGEVARARKAAARAVKLADALGLRPVLVAASSLARGSDRRRRGAITLESGSTLTNRELEVLRLIVEGRTNREIAAALVIGEKTAATHVSNVLAKLGATRRTEAAVAALRLGIAPAEGVSEAR